MHRPRKLVFLCALTFLAACGSSGGSDGPPAAACIDTGTCPEIRVVANWIALTQGGVPNSTEVMEGASLPFYATQVGGQRYFTFFIENPGASTLTFKGTPPVQLSGPDADQFYLWQRGDRTLEAHASTDYFSVFFRPTSVGTKRATISVASDAGSGTFTFTMEGVARDSIWLFRSLQTHDGNLGGRVGADAICATDAEDVNPTMGCATVKAFIGVSSADRIKDLPAPEGHDVRTVADVQVETSWAGLWDGALSADLSSIPGSDGWWSGSKDDGTELQTCAGWTSNGTLDGGTHGSSTTSGAGWAWSGGLGCNFADYMYVLCACW